MSSLTTAAIAGSARGATPGRTAKYLLFAAFGLMTLFVIWNNERFILNASAPEWMRYEPVRWHLLPHGIAGALALVLGVLQFSTRLRRNYPRIHRFSGKVYVVSAFVAALVAVRIAFLISAWFLIPFTIIQAITLMLFTGIAYRCIRRGAIAAHRAWMIRSYAVILIFVEGRVLMAIPVVARGGMDSIVLVNWGCFAVTLVVVECLLQWRDIVPRERKVVSAVSGVE